MATIASDPRNPTRQLERVDARLRELLAKAPRTVAPGDEYSESARLWRLVRAIAQWRDTLAGMAR